MGKLKINMPILQYKSQFLIFFNNHRYFDIINLPMCRYYRSASIGNKISMYRCLLSLPSLSPCTTSYYVPLKYLLRRQGTNISYYLLLLYFLPYKRFYHSENII